MTDKEWEGFKANVKELPKEYGEDAVMFSILINKTSRKIYLHSNTDNPKDLLSAFISALEQNRGFARMIEGAQKIVAKRSLEEYKKSEIFS